MKIALIGPGIMPIPPAGWGAVEILIWEYYQILKEKGHEVDIINHIRKHPSEMLTPYTPYSQSLIKTVNDGKYDFVHLHYDCLYHILPFIKCSKIGITSHYPYIDQVDKHAMDGYENTFNAISQNKNHIIFAVSKKDYDAFIKNGATPNNMYILIGGVPSRNTRINISPKHADKSVYLGKVEPRKAQRKYFSIPDIDFYGPCDDKLFRIMDCYKGELTRDKLYETLSEYGNMVLLSTGENGTPLVIKEALMVGLPIVTNEYSSNDLDLSMPFIDIVPTDKLNNLHYIHTVNQKNKSTLHMRNDIIKYAHENFSLEIIIDGYIDFISRRTQQHVPPGTQDFSVKIS